MMHDGSIISYSVDLEQKQIILTIKNNGVVNKLYFEDVLSNWFRYVLEGNAIYDVLIIKAEDFVSRFAKIILEGKGNGWPMRYRNLDELKQKLEDSDYNIYNIEGAYGVDGWIIAKNMKMEMIEK